MVLGVEKLDVSEICRYFVGFIFFGGCRYGGVCCILLDVGIRELGEIRRGFLGEIVFFRYWVMYVIEFFMCFFKFGYFFFNIGIKREVMWKWSFVDIVFILVDNVEDKIIKLFIVVFKKFLK